MSEEVKREAGPDEDLIACVLDKGSGARSDGPTTWPPYWKVREVSRQH